jgi:hypothetical protein
VKLAAYLFCASALALLAFVLSRSAVNGELTPVEMIVAALVIPAAVTTWRLIVRSRERQKIEAMRDSALW